MITRIRIITAIFALSILTGFGCVPYMMYFGGVERNGIEVFMLLLFIAGVFCVIYFTSIIRIIIDKKEIHIIYPFRLKKYLYSFDDILGYYFSAMDGGYGPEYKVIYFKMKDGRKYGVTDFETSNLRVLERCAIDYFSLWDKENLKIATEERENEILENYKNFDFKQAKEIRWFLFLLLGLTLFFFVGLIKDFSIDRPFSVFNIALYIVAISIITIIDKLMRTQRKIKKGV